VKARSGGQQAFGKAPVVRIELGLARGGGCGRRHIRKASVERAFHEDPNHLRSELLRSWIVPGRLEALAVSERERDALELDRAAAPGDECFLAQRRSEKASAIATFLADRLDRGRDHLANLPFLVIGHLHVGGDCIDGRLGELVRLELCLKNLSGTEVSPEVGHHEFRDRMLGSTPCEHLRRRFDGSGCLQCRTGQVEHCPIAARLNGLSDLRLPVVVNAEPDDLHLGRRGC